MTSNSRCATIDVGSNSVLVHIAERLANGTWTVIVDRSVVTRLGAGLHATGRLSEEAMNRTARALGGFVALAREHAVAEIAAVGTMALRNAANSTDFLRRLRSEHGLEVEVIPGEEEARLCFLAVCSALACVPRDLAVFDVGGGSTEVVFGSLGRIEERLSLDVGPLRLTEEHLHSDPVTEAELSALRRDLERAFSRLNAAPEVLVAMGGAVTNMAAVYHRMAIYDPGVIQGTVVRRAEVERQIEHYRSLPISARRAIPGLQPERADTILASASIVAAVMNRLRAEALIVSDRGVRHGLLVDRFGA